MPTASDLIRQWIRIASEGYVPQAESGGIFFRFMASWVAFNAFYTRTYKKSGDAAGVKAAGEDLRLQAFHEVLLTSVPKYLGAVRFFSTPPAVEDMRFPGDQTKAKKVVNERCWAEVARCLYQVRCNLMHGDKAIDNSRDLACVENALDVMGPLLGKVEAILLP